MAPVKEIIKRANRSMEQMKAKLTTKYEKYDDLLRQLKMSRADLDDHYKSEQNKLQTLQDKQVSGLIKKV